MDDRGAPRMVRYLPQALIATAAVVAWPTVVVWLMRAGGDTGAVLGIVVGVVLSLAASTLGALYWTHLGRSQDVLFSDLMIWGWARRWRAERRLATLMAQLGSATAADWDAVTACIDALQSDGQDSDGDWIAQSRPRLLSKLAEALEAGDPYIRGHSLRVARYATMIAERIGLDGVEVERIRLAGVLHDIGKFNTPVGILHRPGPLADDEFAVVKRHPVDGAELVAALNDPLLTAIVRHHHERLDGRGYPDGLTGSQIPLGARIMAVADTFDAITSARPYRAAAKHERALAVLTAEAGRQLDATAVTAFRDCYADRRSTTKWAVLSSVPGRWASWLGSANPAAAMTVSKAVAAASAVAVVGTASAAVPRLDLFKSAPAQQSAHLISAAVRQGGSRHGMEHSRPQTARDHAVADSRGRHLALNTLTAHGSARLRPRPAWPGSGSRAQALTRPAVAKRAVSTSTSGPPTPTTTQMSTPQAASAATGTTPAGGTSHAAGNAQGSSHGQDSGNRRGGPRGQGNNAAGGHGNSNAGGNGHSNASGNGHSNAGGHGPSSAGGQGNSDGGGQGNSSAGGQGNNSAGGQGNSNAGGQGNSNAGGQGNSNAGG
ncbi:MAG: HD domain-containing phosphohydrolase, partial [Solirubrobacteraceae bacterium]